METILFNLLVHLHLDQAKRVVDFLSGVIYAIEGDIQRIGPKIFFDFHYE